MAYAAPTDWALHDLPTHTEFNQDLIASPLALRSLFDTSVRVHRTANQSLANDARTAISWQASIWNVGTMWVLATNPSRITVPTTGVYLLTAKAPWTANNAGRRGIGYRISGGVAEYDMQFQTAQNGASRENGADLLSLVAGDYVEVYAYQSSGGSLNLLGTGEDGATATLTLVATETTAPIWTPPRAWANGDILTPWRLNTHVRDNLRNRRYFNGQAVKLSLAENLSIPSGERSPITWDVEQWQIGTMWASGSRLTARVAGWYMILATVEWRSDATPGDVFRGVGFQINERSPSFDLQFQSGGTANAQASSNGKALVRLEVDDVFEAYAYHDADQALVLNGDGADRTRVAVALMYA